MLEDIKELGGDVDTIGAMAEAIWGAFNGIDRISDSLIDSVEGSREFIETISSL